MDPTTLEILWTRLVTVTNEQAAALQRTSFTPIVRESGDLSAAVFDPAGRMLAQAVTGTPGHINSLATSMKHFLDAFPPSSLEDGDVLATNDPWLTSGQLNDISVVTPVFRGSTLVGFFGNTCHSVDIGGRGLSVDASEVFEEGLQIPMTKLHERGAPNTELLRLIRANVRAPNEVIGDIHAQVAGNQVGASRLLRYLEEFDLDDLDALGEEILSRSETAARSAILAIPDGTYQHTIRTDGLLDEPVTIACTIVVRGNEILVNYDGSSGQVSKGMNVVLNYTAAYTTYALKCALTPEIPHNDGSFQPITVTAPPGSILNPTFPAAVAGRHIVGHFLPHAVFGALEQVIPDRVIAEGAGNVWLTTVRGKDPTFVTVFFAAGGMGARPDQDGLSTTSFPSGIATAPVELIEASAPIVFNRKELRRDSGGPGRFRGGLGQTIEVTIRTEGSYTVSSLADRFRFAAKGYKGGHDGAPGSFRTSLGTRPDPKLSMELPPGSSFTLKLPGGAGFYDPKGRDPELVAEDVAEGFVSPNAALHEYGVNVTRNGRIRGLER